MAALPQNCLYNDSTIIPLALHVNITSVTGVWLRRFLAARRRLCNNPGHARKEILLFPHATP